MPTAFFRFYAELNDFLPADKRQIEFPYSLDDPMRGSSPTVREGSGRPAKSMSRKFEDRRVSVKELIESLSVPPTEVDLILVEGHPVDFSYLVRDGDRISVYPVFEALNIAPLVRLRLHPLRELRFVLDNHLGKLATYLRLLGFDALYQDDYFSSSPFGRGQGEGRSHDEILVQISVAERRILLTRDRGLLNRKEITHGYCVLATDPEQQLIEVVERLDLSGVATPFKR